MYIEKPMIKNHYAPSIGGSRGCSTNAYIFEWTTINRSQMNLVVCVHVNMYSELSGAGYREFYLEPFWNMYCHNPTKSEQTEDSATG